MSIFEKIKKDCIDSEVNRILLESAQEKLRQTKSNLLQHKSQLIDGGCKEDSVVIMGLNQIINKL